MGADVSYPIAVPAKAGTHQAASAVFFVYLLSSRPHGTLYVGKTVDLLKRVWEHKNKVVSGFTAKYGVDRLVWFEVHESLEAAFRREKQIKNWKRTWKIQPDREGQSGLGRSLRQPLAMNLDKERRPGGSRLSPGMRSKAGARV